jgi:hypothetical protein
VRQQFADFRAVFRDEGRDVIEVFYVHISFTFVLVLLLLLVLEFRIFSMTRTRTTGRTI